MNAVHGGCCWVLCTRRLVFAPRSTHENAGKFVSKGMPRTIEWNGIHISIFHYRMEWERTSGDVTKCESMEEDWVPDNQTTKKSINERSSTIRSTVVHFQSETDFFDFHFERPRNKEKMPEK